MERLTPQEENVMQHIWQLKECAIKDVVERLEEPKPPPHHGGIDLQQAGAERIPHEAAVRKSEGVQAAYL